MNNHILHTFDEELTNIEIFREWEKIKKFKLSENDLKHSMWIINIRFTPALDNMYTDVYLLTGKSFKHKPTDELTSLGYKHPVKKFKEYQSKDMFIGDLVGYNSSLRLNGHTQRFVENLENSSLFTQYCVIYDKPFNEETHAEFVEVLMYEDMMDCWLDDHLNDHDF